MNDRSKKEIAFIPPVAVGLKVATQITLNELAEQITGFGAKYRRQAVEEYFNSTYQQITSLEMRIQELTRMLIEVRDFVGHDEDEKFAREEQKEMDAQEGRSNE